MLVRLASAVLPPTMPLTVTLPMPGASVSAYAPLMVLLKVMALPLVVSVLAAARVTAPV